MSDWWLMLLTIGIMGVSGYTGCMLGLVSRVFAYTSLIYSWSGSLAVRINAEISKTLKVVAE